LGREGLGREGLRLEGLRLEGLNAKVWRDALQASVRRCDHDPVQGARQSRNRNLKSAMQVWADEAQRAD
jgi:hypothetical protein